MADADPSGWKLVETPREIRKSLMALFEHEGWTLERCDLVERLDGLIAKSERAACRYDAGPGAPPTKRPVIKISSTILVRGDVTNQGATSPGK